MVIKDTAIGAESLGFDSLIPKKRRSGGEPLVTLRLISPVRESNSRPSASIAMSLTKYQLAGGH